MLSNVSILQLLVFLPFRAISVRVCNLSFDHVSVRLCPRARCRYGLWTDSPVPIELLGLRHRVQGTGNNVDP